MAHVAKSRVRRGGKLGAAPPCELYVKQGPAAPAASCLTNESLRYFRHFPNVLHAIIFDEHNCPANDGHNSTTDFQSFILRFVEMIGANW